MCKMCVIRSFNIDIMSAVTAISTTAFGAQPAMPDRMRVDDFLKDYP